MVQAGPLLSPPNTPPTPHPSSHARILRRYGQLASPRLAQDRSAHQIEPEALVTCRRQLITVRTEQINRRKRTMCKAALKAIDAVLKALNKQIEHLDGMIRKLIES